VRQKSAAVVNAVLTSRLHAVSTEQYWLTITTSDTSGIQLLSTVGIYNAV